MSKDWNEPFFVFRDRSLVKPSHLRTILCNVLITSGFDHTLYTVYSLRAGRALWLLKGGGGVSVETIKHLGHWKSNAVFVYLK